MTKRRNKILNKWGKALVLALFLAIIFRTFIFQIYTVKSNNMANNIMMNNKVLVSKFSYGFRTPKTVFSLPFFNDKYLSKPSLPYKRLFPKHPTQGEIVAFNIPTEISNPTDKRNISISRCIGIPGDTIQIIKQQLYINGTAIQPNPKALFKYRLFENSNSSKLGFKDTLICNSSLDKIKSLSTTRFVSKLTCAPGEDFEDFFPQNNDFRWNADHFGPVIIPKQDQNIKLTRENLILYSSILNSNKDLATFNDSIFTFKTNYYFVINDNWTNTNDSRKWGFIPEDHLIGKVEKIIQY